ncbi:hypothetical protein ACTG9Q_14740 [Actinokineospora sp. 24-640]
MDPVGGVAHHAAENAPAAWLSAAEPYRLRFGHEFASFTLFTAAQLADLGAPRDLLGLTVATESDPSVVDDLAEATKVANLAEQTVADRTVYRDALLRIYAKLPVRADELTRGDVLCVGPEREGRQLAQDLGALPAGRSLTPSAKRIGYEGGILVGMSALPAATGHRHCVVIDGVVASGATVMALMRSLPRGVERVTLLTAQSTAAGARAVLGFGTRLGLRTEVVVGVVSGVLDESFYAHDERDRDLVVLGDVGDTISGLGAGGTA